MRTYTNVSFGTGIVGNGSEGRVREYSARYEMSLFDRASFNFQEPCRKKERKKKNSNLRAKRREERRGNSESSVTKLYISCYKKKDRREDGRGGLKRNLRETRIPAHRPVRLRAQAR